ncbi:phospholipase A2 [Actinosynnema sp. NPDC023658]|uniref:phospholipase A2 n=1 Tax=Actinosynnema sp. NPDC023658 TaxID=3155465 RepID=UPI0033E57C09
MGNVSLNTTGWWPGLRLLARLPAWFRFVVVTLAVFVCGVIASRPAGATDTAPLTGDVATAARAVEAMANPGGANPLTWFPADFNEVVDRDPLVVTAPDGTTRATSPGGGCSGPAGDTEWDFGTGCRAHDLGYDLLRYAELKGRPLAPEARKALDARLATDMHTQCDLNPRGHGTRCHAAAQLYAAGLEFNSWRQRWGPPGHEPVLAWGFGSAVVVFLLLARLPRRQEPDAVDDAPRPPPAHDRYATFLRLAALGLVVIGQSLITVLHWAGLSANWLWLLTWALQVIPVFYFAGGHANLAGWYAVQAEQGGYGRYLAARISWLLRPVLAFVLAWLVLPLPLELLDVDKSRVETFGRLIAHPLWFLGLYVVAVAATPVMAWLHHHARLVTPVALVAAMIVVDLVRIGFDWRAGGYLNLVLGVLLLQQLGFHYADGSLHRISRKVLAALAVAAVPALLALITFGGYPRTMMPLPGEGSSNLSPPTVCLLVLGLAQICLVLLLRPGITAWLAGSRQWRVVEFARSAPMTVYLGYLTLLATVSGVLGLLDSPSAFDWVTTRPRWLAVLVLLLLPVLLAFHRFERNAAVAPCRTRETHRTRLAVTLGAGYGVLGVLGFVVTGFAGTAGTLVVFEVDPLQNLIHLLLGWYLLHTAHAGTCHGRRPWLLTALACVPPLLALEPTGALVALHGGTIVVALLAAIPKQDQAHAGEHGQPRPALQHP